MAVGSGRSWRFIAPVALASCGLLLAISSRASDGEDFRGSGHEELSDLVLAAESRSQELSEAVEAFTAENEAMANAETGSPQSTEQQQLEELHGLAGFTAVEGPAVQVSLDDSPSASDPELLAPGTNLEDYLVHQQDVEGVINALWAGGAEAMMVMDQRIISTSTVRCIGSVLFLQGKRYAPPYSVTAIGDTDAMMAALDDSAVVRQYRALVDQIGLGFELTISEDVTIPSYEGPVGVSAETAA